MLNPLSSKVFYELSKLKALEFASNPLFREIRLETRTRCNGHCAFCPCSVENETREDITMIEECHHKIIDQLANLNYTGSIGYYINNEPLLDKRIVSFLAYLNSKNLNLKSVRIQTNGILLTKELGVSLFENGLT